MTKTYSAKPTDVVRKWYVLDASELPLGRLATKAATLLMGKGKPQFTKHIDCGDFVVVINAKDLVVSGEKSTKKLYRHYSGYPSGLATRSLEEQLSRDATVPVTKAIRGMLPDNKLRPERLKRLKVYSGSEHQHSAQKPITLNLKEAK